MNLPVPTGLRNRAILWLARVDIRTGPDRLTTPPLRVAQHLNIESRSADEEASG